MVGKICSHTIMGAQQRWHYTGGCYIIGGLHVLNISVSVVVKGVDSLTGNLQRTALSSATK